MSIELNIKRISLPKIPGNAMGKNRALKEVNSQIPEFLELINKDLFCIVENGIGEEVTRNLEHEVLNPLLMFFNSIQNLPSSEVKKILQQQIRFFHLVINNRLYQLQDEKIEFEFTRLFQMITDAIGVVPLLNDNIILPETNFLPTNFSKSVQKWQNTIFKSPSRKSNEGENLNFFTVTINIDNKDIKTSSVRYHLITADSNVNNEGEALSYADADIYAVGDLQVDHLQPSEQIINRQQEMLMAMNIDPIFSQKMYAHHESHRYFKKENEIIYGTKYFYMVYHNCIDNLWLINTAANTGTGKGNKDPIIWLKNHKRFGEVFFHSLGGEQSIDKTKILYITRDNKFLAQAVKEWFLLTYNNEISAVHYIRNNITQPLKQGLEDLAKEIPSRKTRNKMIQTMARMVLAKIIIEKHSSSSETGRSLSSGSTPNSAADLNEANLSLFEDLAKNVQIEDIKQRIENEYKDVHKKRKLGSD